MSKYVQSFYQYPLTFPVIGKTIPCKDADGDMKNIIELTDAEAEKLQRLSPLFRKLVEQKKLRVLNHLPDSYKAAATQINEAKAEAAAARAEAEAAKKELEELKKQQGIVKEPDQETTDDGDLSKKSLKELEEIASGLGLGSRRSKKEYIEAINKAREK